MQIPKGQWKEGFPPLYHSKEYSLRPGEYWITFGRDGGGSTTTTLVVRSGEPMRCKFGLMQLEGSPPDVNVRNVWAKPTRSPKSRLATQPRKSAVKPPSRSPKFGQAIVYTKWPFDAKEAKRRQEETAKALKSKTTVALSLSKSVTMKLILIPAGQFVMGSPKTEKSRDMEEGPQHQVTLTMPFHMGVTEVTQAQWKAVMNTQPWRAKRYVKPGADHAASWISWHQATAFCRALSKKTGSTVRLPTEAEWEYACRAGTTTAYSFGDDSSKLGDYAWYYDNAYKKDEKYVHPVGVKKPNAWGLYDMHGNVEEYCSDRCAWYPSADPRRPKGPIYKWYITRGGSWTYNPARCRAAYREGSAPGDRRGVGGFRVVVEVK